MQQRDWERGKESTWCSAYFAQIDANVLSRFALFKIVVFSLNEIVICVGEWEKWCKKRNYFYAILNVLFAIFILQRWRCVIRTTHAVIAVRHLLLNMVWCQHANRTVCTRPTSVAFAHWKRNFVSVWWAMNWWHPVSRKPARTRKRVSSCPSVWALNDSIEFKRVDSSIACPTQLDQVLEPKVNRMCGVRNSWHQPFVAVLLAMRFTSFASSSQSTVVTALAWIPLRAADPE